MTWTRDHHIVCATDQRSAGVGVRVAALSTDIAVDAGGIPRVALADPVDRLLVATARQIDATFLTRDASTLEYASTTRSVLDAAS